MPRETDSNSMAERFDWRNSDDQRDLVHRAVQSLVEGNLVVFPTVTVHALAAHAASEASVRRLLEAKRGSDRLACSLALRTREECHRFVPDMSKVESAWSNAACRDRSRRFFRRTARSNPWRNCQARLAEAGRFELGLSLSVPDHPAILETLRLMPGPVVLTSASPAGTQDPSIPKESAWLTGRQ